jgi:hypothetical protein
MTHSENKRIEAVTTYLILGKLPLVASTIGVPLATLKAWKTSQWWHDLVAEIQIESDVDLDVKLAKRIDKALELVNDRLDNGDYLYDPKTGSFIRKPVNIRDGWKVASEMIDRRWLLRKQPKDVTSQEEIGAILKNLATEFADMARKRVNEKIIEGEVVDVTESEQTELQEGVRQLPRDAGADSEPVEPQQSQT